MIEVERVAGAGDVLIEAAVGLQPVIGEVVDAAERQRRPELVALAGVVVDDVENDLDAGVVQALDRRLELGDRAVRQKARIGREKPDRVVAPVIRPARARRPVRSVTAAWTGSSSTAVTPSSIR